MLLLTDIFKKVKSSPRPHIYLSNFGITAFSIWEYFSKNWKNCPKWPPCLSHTWPPNNSHKHKVFCVKPYSLRVSNLFALPPERREDRIPRAIDLIISKLNFP